MAIEKKKEENTALVEIIQKSELKPDMAKFLQDNFNDYFTMATEWKKKAGNIKVTNESQTADMEMARVGRLFLRDKRIDVEKARKKLKEQSLREGKAIDGIANVLKALIIPIEEQLEQQEKFVEFKREKEKELARIAAEEKIEADRIAEEKRVAEEQERTRLENIKLKKEADAREKVLADERAKADEDKRKADEKLRKTKEAAEKKRKDAEAKAKREKEKAEEEAYIRERQLKAKADRERKAEEDKRKKAEAELQAKKDAETKAQADKEAEEEARKSASDDVKLEQLAEDITKISTPFPAVKSKRAKDVLDEVEILLQDAVKILTEK